jgi:hypothetical protein
LNELQQKIYNTFLKNLRYGLPYRSRKDFSNLDETEKNTLERLSYFFEKYKHINIYEFFEAPRIVYSDEKYPNLKYFLSRNAIKTYTTYKNQKEDENPEKQLNEIKKSIMFIGKFCIKNNISMFDYLKHKTGYVPSWINHYRERKINPYSLMELGNFEKDLYSLTEEEKDIYVKNFTEKLESYKVRYFNSSKTKNLVKVSTKKIKNFVEEYLQNKKNSDSIYNV